MDNVKPNVYYYLLAFLCIAIGLTFTISLSYSYFTGTSGIACSSASGCASVSGKNAAYSSFLGVPLALWGLGFQLMAILYFLFPTMNPNGVNYLRVPFFILLVIASLIDFVLLMLMIFVIKAFCIECFIIHLSTFTLLFLIFWFELRKRVLNEIKDFFKSIIKNDNYLKELTVYSVISILIFSVLFFFANNRSLANNKTVSHQSESKILEAPKQIEINNFELGLLKNIESEEDKKDILSFYKKDSDNKFYKLKNNLSKEEKLRLSDILKAAKNLHLNRYFEVFYKNFDKRFAQNINTDKVPFEGDKNSPLHFVIFHDFQCHHCQKAYFYFKKIVKKYNHLIRVSYFNYPLFQNTSKSQLTTFQLIQYSLVAHEFSKYFDFMELIFKNFENGNYIDKKKIQEIFKSLKINISFDEIEKKAIQYTIEAVKQKFISYNLLLKNELNAIEQGIKNIKNEKILEKYNERKVIIKEILFMIDELLSDTAKNKYDSKKSDLIEERLKYNKIYISTPMIFMNNRLVVEGFNKKLIGKYIEKKVIEWAQKGVQATNK
ncbi:MAG: hypothetical protein OEV44_02235 [Spirochaetota bacterium]|nr:hypothetical protein [Spirochaetota bacterium]